MNKLELQKTAVEVRKGIVSAVHSAKAGHPAWQKTCFISVNSTQRASISRLKQHYRYIHLFL